MKMGPDYTEPDIGVAIPPVYQQAREDVGSGPASGLIDPWWKSFQKPALDGLVEEALRNNLDLRKATHRVLEIRTRFIQARGSRLPSLNFQAGAQVQRNTVTVAGAREDRITAESYNLSLPASFEWDLWGRLARAEEAALADLLQAEENRHTIAQTVVAETVSLLLQIESIERRIQITEESIQTFRLSAQVVENRYRRGLISLLDVSQAKRVLTQAEALLPTLRQELGRSQQRLAVLLGRYPETKPAGYHPEDYFMEPPPVPPGLPSELLLRRPDIQAAEATLKSLNANVGVAKASRFPRITLTGGYGYRSDELQDFFGLSNSFWNIAGGLVQPLFDGGRQRANQRAAEERYQQGLMDYTKIVLNAFAEVELALLTREEQMKRRQRLLLFLEEARITQEVAQNRYLKGLVGYLNVLDAQQTRFQAEQNLVDVDLAILTNHVSLHRALGGGWADPGPVDPHKDIYHITAKEYLP
jgi:multidrug efflux system outer membrane protein